MYYIAILYAVLHNNLAVSLCHTTQRMWLYSVAQLTFIYGLINVEHFQLF